MSNENIIKSVHACQEVIKVEQAKISKIVDILKDLIDKYYHKCEACSGNYKLSSYTYMHSHHVDMDSDWLYNNLISWDRLKCPKCKKENKINISDSELVEMIDLTTFSRIKNFNGSRC